MNGVVNPRIAVACNADGRLEVFGIGTDGYIWHNWQTSAGQVFNGWVQLGGSQGIQPGFVVAINHDGRLELFGTLSDTSVQHVWQSQPGTSWHSWSNLGGSIDRQLVVCNNQNGALQVFGIGTASRDVWSIVQQSPGGSWGSWFDMGGNGMKFYFGQ